MKAWLPPIALAGAAAIALAAGCGGLLIINGPPDGGPPPCCDGGLPDGGSTDNGPPDRNNTTLLALPSTTVVADGSSTVTLRVIVRDAAGHLLRGVGVTFTCDGTSNTFLPASGSGYTEADGSFQVALSSTRAEPKTVTVAVGATGTFTLTRALTFIAGYPDVQTSSLALAPSSLNADGVAAADITATLRDRFGNIVAGNNVAFSSTGANNTFNPASGVAVTDATGVARMRLSSTRAEAKTVVATVGSLFVMTKPVTFVPGPASLAMSSLTANPTTLQANGAAQTTLTALLRDAQGNPIPSLPATFSVTGTGNTWSPGNTATTNVDGVARVYLSSTVAQTKTVTVQVASLTMQTTVRFGAGSPTNGNSSITVDPTVVADGNDDGLITVSVRDGTNNPVQGQPVTLTATGSTNTFTPASSGNTDAAGLFTARLSSIVAEVKAVDATLPTFTLSANMTFVPGPPHGPSSQLTALPERVPADGTSVCNLTVVVRDAEGNTIPGLGVTLSSTGSSNTFNRTTGNTDANGSFTATLRSTRAELKTITATVGAVSLQATVQFDPGQPNLGMSSVAADPPTGVANGYDPVTVTATIRDAIGNPVSGVVVAISATGTGHYFWPDSTGFTGANGTYSALMYSTVTGPKTLTATCGSIAPTGTVTFAPGPPSSSYSSLTFNPPSLRADGTTTTNVTFTARDINANPVPGALVTFETLSNGNRWTPASASGTTNASGVFTAQLASTVAETKWITGITGETQISASVTFTP